MVQTELAMKQNLKERGQSGSCQGGEAGEGMEGEAEVRRCRLLYREGINNKVLLNSTGNCAQ